MRIDSRMPLLLLLLAACAGPNAADGAAEASATDTAVLASDAAVSAPDTPAAPTPGAARPANEVAPAPRVDARPAPQVTTGYRLELDHLERWATATANVRRAAQADPGLAAVLQAMPVPQTLDQMEAAYAGLRPARQAIEAAGINVREFARIGFAFARAAMAADAIKSGARRDSVAEAMRVSAHDIDFVLQNEAAIGRIFQRLEQNRP